MPDNKQLCPECGAEIPADAPAGQCPRCMMKAGFESEDGSEPQFKATVQSPGSSGFEPPAVDLLNKLFPQLEVLELLGRGGMGAVYKARQPELDRLVAVKILPPEVRKDPSFAERFAREARALARLSHPNIVVVHDFGRTDQIFYLVMEYVDGANLRQTMQSGSLQPEEALAIVPQICNALQYAHDEGVVHRDIKPENILLDKKGRLKIADFGLSKLLNADQPEVTLTGTHQVMGTLRYMAPEQMKGTHNVDHRADIYSLGVVFYELLTGDVPIGCFDPPSKRVQIDVRLDEVVLRALAQEPDKRYQAANDVKADVESITFDGTKQTTASANADASQAARKDTVHSGWEALRPKRNRWITNTIKAVLLVAYACCLVLFFSYQSHYESGPPEGWRHQVGFPSPWFVAETYPGTSGSFGPRLSLSWIFPVLAFVAYCTYWFIARIDAGAVQWFQRPNTHFAFWFLLGVFVILRCIFGGISRW